MVKKPEARTFARSSHVDNRLLVDPDIGFANDVRTKEKGADPLGLAISRTADLERVKLSSCPLGLSGG